MRVKAVPLEGMSDPSRIEWGDESIMIDSIDSRFTAPLGRSPKTRPSRGIIVIHLIIMMHFNLMQVLEAYASFSSDASLMVDHGGMRLSQ